MSLFFCQIGLPASTTAASFGKVNSNKLSDYKVEDLAAALLNSFTYNIGQVFFSPDIMVTRWQS
jgi:type II pantothenate kinase